MRAVLILLIAGLIVAHQDFWYWEDTTLVWGVLPMGLFYHVCISLAASLVWLIACTFAWPKGIDEFEEDSLDNSTGGAA
ncbi:MAG: DUF3311 domain-containing protein [Planctomycetota bacterium]